MKNFIIVLGLFTLLASCQKEPINQEEFFVVKGKITDHSGKNKQKNRTVIYGVKTCTLLCDTEEIASAKTDKEGFFELAIDREIWKRNKWNNHVFIKNAKDYFPEEKIEVCKIDEPVIALQEEFYQVHIGRKATIEIQLEGKTSYDPLSRVLVEAFVENKRIAFGLIKLGSSYVEKKTTIEVVGDTEITLKYSGSFKKQIGEAKSIEGEHTLFIPGSSATTYKISY